MGKIIVGQQKKREVDLGVFTVQQKPVQEKKHEAPEKTGQEVQEKKGGRQGKSR